MAPSKLAMAVASSNERIQPCLFDRLIDGSPGERLESRADRVFSKDRYLEAVIRDLTWLLNCDAHIGSEGWEEFPEVEKSVLNFGKRGFAGATLSILEPSVVEGVIKQSILRFEPRINPETLRVKCVATAGTGRYKFFKTQGAYNCLNFEISGELWAYPAPEEFFFKTTLDLDTGMEIA